MKCLTNVRSKVMDVANRTNVRSLTETREKDTSCLKVTRQTSKGNEGKGHTWKCVALEGRNEDRHST